MSVTTRKAGASDSGALSHVIDAAYAPARATLPDLPDVSGGLADDIAAGSVWVAQTDGAVVGGAVLGLGDYAHLVNLAVHPDFGGRGIARALIDVVQGVAKDAGFTALHLATHVGMPENVAMYHHLGWREVSRTGSKVMMVKPL
ncbi:GNAT family N-acetyltransferase [Aliiroseovarius subalbicans]|uniref:GNAT family N-acetyltransferase n=1 Tax=Aliiroseovarius subalbicans TaxID=2925840 RepID=UPI001F57E250|nr:GNAT family N-acetyltransferase [Aliiroseovarius subalbicans]MCI2399897.1 GNAT family N-acetyltransferase [Aliiroseovarius subalbicans]